MLARGCVCLDPACPEQGRRAPFLGHPQLPAKSNVSPTYALFPLLTQKQGGGPLWKMSACPESSRGARRHFRFFSHFSALFGVRLVLSLPKCSPTAAFTVLAPPRTDQWAKGVTSEKREPGSRAPEFAGHRRRPLQASSLSFLDQQLRVRAFPVVPGHRSLVASVNKSPVTR